MGSHREAGVEGGPGAPTEPGFSELLKPCADGRLAYLGLGESACEALDARPAGDPCERALRQLTALTLNVCSGALTDSCAVQVSGQGCASTTVGELIDEAAGLIQEGRCGRANDCVAAVNEGTALESQDDL